jgi:large subunit ribosomal protein L5
MGKVKEKKQKGAVEAPAASKKKLIEEKVPVRLHERYKHEIVPYLMKRFSYKNVMQVPHLTKICINTGIGAATQDPKLIDVAVRELEIITGQKVVVTKSRKSISNFKLRENVSIGVRVTLRRARMYEFLDRFISIAVPRIRDFRGMSDKSFDGRGNYTVGVKEQIIFPEIDVDKVTKILGMDVSFITTARTDEEAYELLKALGMPFVKRDTAPVQA